MRLVWYAGASTALAASVVLSAFHQRANFYSAMVYLAQSNFCLLILVNFIYLIYGSFIYGLQRIFYGPLRQVEVEQLSEKAWFAITETCLAMTIFREEIGAWFLVMFTALVTGKVWGWIGDGRVEVLEQQPPANPGLFHTRLSISLVLSMVYDMWLLTYTINTVIQQARPNMMVMFLFEFAVLATCSSRTAIRYVVSVMEARIVKTQTRQRLEERRREVREQREELIRQREQDPNAEASTDQPELPREEDIDEMDIEVPGWEAKGQWILALDLVTDGVKLVIYVAFFTILLTFYGLPIHIMRDLFMTARSFIKRGSALYRYRKAVEDMNRYPDATLEELTREDTCIICREEMRPWDPANNPGAVERTRPKKLPCGHILHFGCLKSWLERQQVCPTCRNPVVGNNPAAAPNREAVLARIGLGGLGVQPPAQAQQQPPANGPAAAVQPQAPRNPAVRMFNLGPIRLGFAQGAENMQELAQRMDLPPDALAPRAAPVVPTPTTTGPPTANDSGSQLPTIRSHIRELDQMIQREIQSLQATQMELQTVQLLTAELHRIRQFQQHQEQGQNAQPNGISPFPTNNVHQPQQAPVPFPQMPQMPQMHMPQMQLPHLPLHQTIRLNGPTVTRHGAMPYSNVIPAGSPELPEGVVIPPGWSLLPLQRLDGTPAPFTPPSFPESTPPVVGENAPISNTVQQGAPPPDLAGGLSTVANVTSTAPVTQTTESTQPVESTPIEPRISAQAAAASLFTARTESPPVLAPNPVAPNWGGANQLFGNGTGLNPLANPPQPIVPAEEPTVEEPVDKNEASVSPTPQHEEGGESSAVNKGKGKAVTVEEAPDED